MEQQSKDQKQEIEESKIKIQQISHQNERFEQEIVNAKNAVVKLERENEWIAGQKQYFGQKGTPYDFENHNMIENRKKQIQLRERKDGLNQSVDREVMGTIDRYEKKEKELKTMYTTVRKDKKKIEDTMDSLDGFKRDALAKTFTQVNVEFGNIFSDLLPVNPGSERNTAKLEPCNFRDLSEGLEVKVCLGGVWKQSLMELSGGQRSLIALSLILALLQFKPAPMYILDEVDAALDLSHTQNIGQLFRERFKGSQFIVVSLKEGMFNNANVVMRAKLRNGMSMVERIVQRATNQVSLQHSRSSLGGMIGSPNVGRMVGVGSPSIGRRGPMR
ncbi:Structural maintenance of chromosomes protein 2 [Nowakowskiella sp. JEL0078]|nr:Structural maintenance of chromosomes protein 2 [Nowakowskiella sp. JEL0078]